ncbi:hypothetical protein E5F05_11380 [Deinococcus metallilatus]|uniref:Uncharacterized protein n=2 Tax=Deinococcus TaxID=1298 RepID=A0AAJ5F3G4_9DEIO|nr:hypothetical protein [Deinococcus metallilatus]MBB5296480.1 hypothetical protein [Deinococcus metallilatus]QBY08487.1 hypothetical protein E5F05_11380 [Deinococcus metallilatus]RXJ11286.1 hypothetical protein ERJ73_10200 [Deinococcus metallilatus]TLK24777.1 hypothetical protein FCS05_14635 [Deinococcus metallilatus]GMA17397.1 hypothetical protein GCM10025871_37280 [Deinococcus metallilatus]
MRFLLLALVAAALLLYFTFGLRFGYVTLTPTHLLNAQGQNRYAFQLYEDGKNVGVTGTCAVRSGQATLRLLDPSGTQVAGQSCQPGTWSLKLMGGGHQGVYRLIVDLNHYTGMLDLQETRE